MRRIVVICIGFIFSLTVFPSRAGFRRAEFRAGHLSHPSGKLLGVSFQSREKSQGRIEPRYPRADAQGRRGWAILCSRKTGRKPASKDDRRRQARDAKEADAVAQGSDQTVAGMGDGRRGDRQLAGDRRTQGCHSVGLSVRRRRSTVSPSVTTARQLAAACRSEVVLIPIDDAPLRRASHRLRPDHLRRIQPRRQDIGRVRRLSPRFGEISFFNPGDGQVISTRRLTRDTLFHGDFAPDGKSFAVGAADGAVYFVPVDQSAEVRSSELHSDWVLSVAYSPDGKWIVTGGRDKATKVALASTGSLLATMDMSTDMVTAVASDSLTAIGLSRKGDLLGYDYKIALSGVEVNGSGNGRCSRQQARPVCPRLRSRGKRNPGDGHQRRPQNDRRRHRGRRNPGL